MRILKEIKIIWEYLRKYKNRVIKIMILALVQGLIVGIIPYIYGKLVDIVSVEVFSLSFFFCFLGIWALMSLCSSIFKRNVSLRGAIVAVDIYADSICESYGHIINLPLSFHREKKLGEILSRINRAASSIEDAVDRIVFTLFPELLTVFIGISILFFIDYRLSFITFIIFILSVMITIYRTPLVLKSSKEFNEVIDRGSGILSDSILNIQTVKSCVAENFEKSKIQKLYRGKIRLASKKILASWMNTVLLQRTFFSFGFVLVFSYAIYLLRLGEISGGELVMFLGYLNIVDAPLENLLYNWFSFQKGMTVIEGAREFLEIDSEDYQNSGKILKRVDGKIEFKNISFGYKKQNLILRDINFIAKANSKIALVGGSGEGKTTLVDLISLYFKPNKGKVLLDDVNIQELNLTFLRKLIAYVPQEITLFNDTIKNNISYGGLKVSKEEVVNASKIANAHRFIKLFPKKYNTIVGERGIKLSTGQKQRIAIARAVIQDPKILILDEATSSLDTKSEKLVHSAIDRLIKNKTTFIIAHRLSTIREADEILVLENGKIVERGTHEKLIKKRGAYFKFYSLQFGSK